MRKRLVYRADDIGYSRTFNDGAFKAIQDGIVTSADIMLDSPGTIDALIRLRDYPWISYGWHAGHLWGSPVAPPEKVPHMVDPKTGKFFWGHNTKLQETVPYEEAYIEWEAQLQLSLKVCGRVPDGTTIHGSRPIDIARRDVCDKYGVLYGFAGETSPSGESVGVLPKYESLKYRQWDDPDQPKRQPGHDRRSAFALDQYYLYDPVGKIKKITWTEAEEVWRTGGHPGFLDDLILSESSCNIHRVKDVIALTSQELKDWIISEGVELVNQRDVIYGTHEYQDHLRAIGSPLAVKDL